MFQGSDLKENSSVNSPDSDILYTAIPLESASDSWIDLNTMVFGSFHQNDTRFSELPEDIRAHVMHYACWYLNLS